MLAALRALPGPTPTQSTPNTSTSSLTSQDPPAALLARSTITVAPTSRDPLTLYLSERRYHAITLAELGVEEKNLPRALRRSIEDWNERKRPQPVTEEKMESDETAQDKLERIQEEEEEKRVKRERKYVSFRELGVKPPVCARGGNVELETNARRQCRV